MTDENERPEYYARNVSILDCVPGNFEHADGEPASILTVAHPRSGEVSKWAIRLRDSRLLAVKLLVAIATCEDRFAQRLLDDHFSADSEGNFRWPEMSDT